MHLLARLFCPVVFSQKFFSSFSRGISADESAFSLGRLPSGLLQNLLAAGIFLLSGMYCFGQTTFTVTTNSDSGPGSLREAVGAANGSSSAVIAFDPSLSDQTITLTSGGLTISAGVTMDGQNASGLTISGNNAYTIFTVDLGGRLDLANVALTSGKNAMGGAIFNNGTLSVVNSTFSGNSAVLGGAIFNQGTLTVTNSTFSSNSGTGGGGGAINNFGMLTVANTTFSGNSASGANSYGGAIANHSLAMVSNSIFSGNSATQWGGGIDDFTGGVHASYNVYWKNTDLGGGGDCNYCASNSNGIWADPMLLPLANYGGPTQTMYPMGGAVVCAGSASLAIDANSNPLRSDQRGQPPAACTNGRVTAGAVQPVYLVVNTTADSFDSSCTNSTCSLRDAINAANNSLGADIVFDSSLNGKTITLSSMIIGITGRQSILGPGANLLTISDGGSVDSLLLVYSDANVLLDGLTVANGSANISGGAVFNNGALIIANAAFSNNSARSYGGAIFSSGSLTVTNSTFSNNSAQVYGGAVMSHGTLTVTNSTFSGNSAGVDGGALYTYDYGALTVTNSTLSGNSAQYGGAVYNSFSSTATVLNNIISGNSAINSGGGIYDESNGVQASYNAYHQNTDSGSGGDCKNCGSNNNAFSGDPKLAPLGYYGGWTQTMPPQPGSTALNAGVYQTGEPTTDQRGAPRPGSGAIDAGAVQISNNSPMLGAVNPNYGPMTGGTPVTLMGTGLDSAASVSFGGVAATSSSQFFTSLTAVSPATSSSGTVQIRVSNGSGTIPFTYYAPLAFSPAAANFTGSYGAAFSDTFALSGGSGNYTVTSTSLPSFLALNCSAAQCTLSGTPTQTGSFSFTLTVNDATYSGVTSGAAVYTLTVQASPNARFNVPSLTYGHNGGQLIMLSPPSGLNTVPTGTISCSIDGGTATVGALNSNGETYIPVASSLSAGSHALQCSYSGDGNYTGASFTSSLNIAAAPLTVTANDVTRVYGTVNPNFTGMIAGAQNGDSFSESFSTTAVTYSPVGTYEIIPAVTGANLVSYTQVITNGTLAVTKAGTTVALRASSASIGPGTSVTLTAQVVSATTGTPTGTVSFYDGSTLLGTATLNNGVANYSTTALTALSTHTLTATYSGDPNFTQSTTAAGVSVVVAALDFNFQATGPITATVAPGGSATFSYSIAPTNGIYPAPVTFTATGPSTGLAYSLSQTTIPTNAGPQTITLTVSTAGLTTAVREGQLWGFGGTAVAFCVLFPMGMLRRGRNVTQNAGRRLLLTLLVTGASMTVLGLSGCGSGRSTNLPQSYSVTVTAASGSITHTSTVSMIVH